MSRTRIYAAMAALFTLSTAWAIVRLALAIPAGLLGLRGRGITYWGRSGPLLNPREAEVAANTNLRRRLARMPSQSRVERWLIAKWGVPPCIAKISSAIEGWLVKRWVASLYSETMIWVFPELRAKLHEDTVPFAGVRLHEEEVQQNMISMNGAPGTGKSLTLATLLNCRARKIRPGSNRRMIGYDYKNEIIRLIASLEPEVPAYIMIPSHLYSVPWDVARDLNSPARVRQFWMNAIPDVAGENSPFFRQATRGIAEGITESLAATHCGAWSLADVTRILDSEHWTREVLARSAQSRSKLRFLQNPELFANIQASIETLTAPLRIVAAYWYHAKAAPLSLAEFFGDEGFLILGSDPGLSDVSFMNDLMLKFLVEEALRKPDGTCGVTDVVIDETTALNEDKPSRFMRDGVQRGRSRNMNFMFTYQAKGDWEAIYNKFANGILGMARHQVCLGTGDVETAKHDSELMGRGRGREIQTSVTRGLNASSTTTTANYFDRETVPYTDFLRLPPASVDNGIWGYASSPSIGAWWFHLDPEWVDENRLHPHPDVEAFVPRPVWQQYLPPFTLADLRRLGLTPDPDMFS